MERSRDKSLFLCRERDVLDRLTEEAWLRRELAVQFASARQKVVELTPATEEVANLLIREVDAHRHAAEVKEKATALIERAHKDDIEAKRVWKKRYDLLQTMAGLHAKRDSARQEHDYARGRVNDLLGEVEMERG
jgi:hypothetical protein